MAADHPEGERKKYEGIVLHWLFIMFPPQTLALILYVPKDD